MNANGGRDEEADRESSAAGGASAAAPRVPLYRMFGFADRTDAALMAVGVATAVANGMAQPLMTFIFGDVIDAFGSTSSPDVLHKVSKVIMNFVYLGIGAGLVSTLREWISYAWKLGYLRSSSR